MKACSSCGGGNRIDALFCASCGRAFGLTCPSCETPLADGTRFCHACGEPVQEQPSTPLKIRRTVTVVFNDLVGSTPLGERLDPEALRAVIERYLQDAARIVEGYGGEVMQFRGDGVMAVFGAPIAHEDDAYRAVRAAIDMSEMIHSKDAIGMEARTGVNTGEILWSEEGGRPIVVGDAINVGARLQEVSAPGEVVLGDATFSLVKDQVRAEAMMDLTLKGKTKAITAWRFIELIDPVPERGEAGTRFVGREREIDLLQHSFERTCTESVCQLVTLLGEAGVGKTRLVAELRGGLTPEPRFISGRCLSYGHGITFWPVVELIGALAGITPQDTPHIARSKIEGLFNEAKGGAGATDAIAQVLGLTPTTVATEQVFWAVGRALKEAAQRQPLVVLVEDLHWAEPTFLDLLEHLASWITDAPIFLVCTSREELLESRPTWGGGRSDTLTLRLRPLAAEHSDHLLKGLLGDDPALEELRQKVAEAAGGNPLFIEETAAMLLDERALQETPESDSAVDHLDELHIPPSLQALLAARLDALSPEERRTIGTAAVMGSVFSAQGVTALSQGEEEVTLERLLRRGLVVPGAEEFGGEPTYRFRHILIRDAAYEMLAKETRADLHKRYALWLEEMLGDRAPEYEEIIGFHYERSYRLSAELGRHDPALRGLAVDRLSAAGIRAERRGDSGAAVSFLQRALALGEEGHPREAEISLHLSDALFEEGRWQDASELLRGVTAKAMLEGEAGVAATARLYEARIDVVADDTVSDSDALRSIEEAIQILEKDPDEAALARGWHLRGFLYFGMGRMLEAFSSYEQAISCAVACGDQKTEAEARRSMLGALIYGPTPTSIMLEIAEEHLQWSLDRDDRVTEARARATIGIANAMRGDIKTGRQLLADSRNILEEVGAKLRVAWIAQEIALVELLGGDPRAAERVLLPSYGFLGSIGEKAVRASMADSLAEAMIQQGRFDEADAYTMESEQLADADDIFCQSAWRRNRAKICVARGQSEEAKRLASESLAHVEGTDALTEWCRALFDVADVYRECGMTAQSREFLERAKVLLLRKENLVEARRADELIALGSDQPGGNGLPRSL